MLYEPLNAPALSNNRLTGFGYDAAGNMTSNGSATYTYDDENRVISTGGYTYVYDGDGQRVMKSSGSTGMLYWGAGPLAESDLSGNLNEEYLYFQGMRVAQRDVSTNAVHYYFGDQVNSARLAITPLTSNSVSIDEETDYYPYGGEMVIQGSTTATRYKFTGKERDTESNLDNFGARYYTSNLGRFMTPDWAARPTAVPYAVFGDPQSLNLYGYVRNDPVTRADADGHCDNAGALGSTCPAAENNGRATEGASKAQNQVTFSDTKTTHSYDEKTNTETTTTVTTSVTLSTAKGHEGDFVSADVTTSTHTKNYETGEKSDQTATAALNFGQATRAVGAENMAYIRDAVTPGMVTHFGSITAQDARKNPGKYVAAGGGIASLILGPAGYPVAAGVARVVGGLGALYQAVTHWSPTP